MGNQESVPPISLATLALYILRQGGPDSASTKSGSIVASERQAWRYENDCLTEVPWQDYERALGSAERRDWPPQTLTFSVLPGRKGQPVKVRLTTDYAMGICEESRGGEEEEWTLSHENGSWLLLEREHLMSWD